MKLDFFDAKNDLEIETLKLNITLLNFLINQFFKLSQRNIQAQIRLQR
jgi:hypothetical protein